MRHRYGVIVTAAGASRRFGTVQKKEYSLLENKPVLVHSLEVFLQFGLLGPIAVTIPQGDEKRVRALLSPFFDPEKVMLVPGGNSRQSSVYNALKALSPLSPEFILIHDGARPRVTPWLIREVLAMTCRKGAAIPVTDMVNALVKVDENGRVNTHLSRERIKAVQTPQGFRFDDILSAHRAAAEQGVEAVDDACLLRLLGKDVYVVPGYALNKKITYPEDLV